MADLKERIVGAMLGAAVGDALGFPVDTMQRGALRDDPVRDMRDGGPHRQSGGTWSENMSLTFCLAESLIKGFDVHDQADGFCKWYLEGRWTPYGETFDVKPTISAAIEKIAAGTSLSAAVADDALKYDNGSLARTLPVALWGRDLPVAALLEKTHTSSAITHGHPRALITCGLFALYASSLVKGRAPAEALTALRENVPSLYAEKFRPFPRQMRHFGRLLAPGFEKLGEAQIKSDKEAVHSLEAGVWCLVQGKSFEDTVLRAINLGGDASTIGAVAGGLAGACYGESAVPKRWVKRLARADEIVALVGKFAAACVPVPQ